MFCKLLIYIACFWQISDTPAFPCRYIYFKRWLKKPIGYSISEHIFVVSSWWLSYRKSVLFDIALVGAPKWAWSKNFECLSVNHGFINKTILPNSLWYFTKWWTNTFSAEHFVTLEVVLSNTQYNQIRIWVPGVVSIKRFTEKKKPKWPYWTFVHVVPTLHV